MKMSNALEPPVEERGSIEPYAEEKKRRRARDSISDLTVWASSGFITYGGYHLSKGVVEKIATQLGFYGRDILATNNIIGGTIFTLFGVVWYDLYFNNLENIKKMFRL